MEPFNIPMETLTEETLKTKYSLIVKRTFKPYIGIEITNIYLFGIIPIYSHRKWKD